MRSGLLAALALTLAMPMLAAAQLAGTSGGIDGEAFSVAVNPQYPVPYGQASLSFVSNVLDLNNTSLTVSSGGKTLYQGSVKTVAIPLGKAGSLTSVTIKMTSGGASYSKTVSIRPQDVVLVAEPLSSAPPLYAGKSLVPEEGDVRVVAVATLRNAQGVTIDPSLLSYSWTVEDTRFANSSGIGKQTIIVASPLQYRARDVLVRVVSQDGSLVGGATLTLESEDPTLRVYENDPLLGIRFDHALGNSFAITNAESALYAAPYSLPTTDGQPLVQWFLNGTLAQTGNSITVRPTGSGSGTASLSAVASSGTNATITALLSLAFGQPASSNFFGL